MTTNNTRSLQERLRAVAEMDLHTGGFLAHTMDTAAEALSVLAAKDAEIEECYETINVLEDLAGETLAHFDGDEVYKREYILAEWQAYFNARKDRKPLPLKSKDAEIDHLRHDLAYHMHMAGEDKRKLDTQDAEIARITADLTAMIKLATSYDGDNDKYRGLLEEAVKALGIVQKENERARREFTNISNNIISDAIDSTLTKLKATDIQEK